MIKQIVQFTNVVQDVSGGNLKLPQSAFQRAGSLAVVDQGQKFVAGYTDELAYEFRSASLPVIVFGDHTKAIKYIDFPFAMGADGVKVLKPTTGCDTKYLYHYLRYAKIPDAGYSRHYKFLKELHVPLPSIAEQRRIVAILDKADALRTKRREAIAKLDQLLQSVFLDMFGDPISNPKGWAQKDFRQLCGDTFRNGLSPSTTGLVPGEVLTLSAITGKRFDFSCRKAALFDTAPANSQVLSIDTFMICRGNGNKHLVGSGFFSDRNSTQVCFPDTMIGATVDQTKIKKEFLEIIWKSRKIREQIERGARTTNGTYKVNQSVLGSVKVLLPPVDEQERFATFFRALDSRRREMLKQEVALASFFESLQGRAFSNS